MRFRSLSNPFSFKWLRFSALVSTLLPLPDFDTFTGYFTIGAQSASGRDRKEERGKKLLEIGVLGVGSALFTDGSDVEHWLLHVPRILSAWEFSG